MIAHSSTSYKPIQMNQEGVMRTILTLLGPRQRASLARWDCNICGMIHTGESPLVCDSCGSKLLTRQPHTHIEMSNHW